MRKIKRIVALLAVLSIVFSGTVAYAAVQEGPYTCDHHSVTSSETVGYWVTSHTVYWYDTYGNKHSETCYIHHYIERITSYCSKCLYVFGHLDRERSAHSICAN